MVGTGVALAVLVSAQAAAHRREIAELRRELGNVCECLAHLEGVIDIIRTRMQLSRIKEHDTTQS